MPRACQARELLLARAEGERERRIGALVGHGEAQALDLPQHTSFYTRIAQTRAADGSTPYGATRIDVPRNGDRALEIRIASSSTFVAGAEGTHARVDHALDLSRRQAHACLGRVGALHLALSVTGACTLAVTRASPASSAETAATGATCAGTVAAPSAGPPTRIERTRSEGNTPFFRTPSSTPRTSESGARATAEHDLLGSQPAERISHRTDATERLRDLF